MDRAAIIEIFDYNEFAWRQLVAELAPLGDDLLAKPAPGSGWPALGNCLGHIIYGYDVWLDTLDGKPRLNENEAPLIATLSAMARESTRVQERFRSNIGSLSDADLQRSREFSVYGETLAYTPADLLGNLVLHERGHHGDVNTLLYQHGVDAGVPDYRFFVNEKRGYQ